MKKWLFITCILLAVNYAFGQSCVDTLNIYKFNYNGRHYELVKEMKIWDSARACALKSGGYLAQIDNQAEQDIIYSAIINTASVSPSYTTVADGGGVAYVWIGATDKYSEGWWIWGGKADTIGVHFWNGEGSAGAGGGASVSGKYNNWGKSSGGTIQEPDNYSGLQDGGAMSLAAWPYGIAGQWNDIKTSNSLYYVVEYDSVAHTGVNDAFNENVFPRLFPNPAQERVCVKSGIGQVYTLYIQDAAGRILLRRIELTNGLSIDIAQLAPGCYLSTLVSEEGQIFHEKIVVCH